MMTLTAQQMNEAQNTPPVAMKVQETHNGPVIFSVIPVFEGFALTSTPFEVVGAFEHYPRLVEAIARMLECSRAVAKDEFPPARHEQVAA